MNDCHQDIVDTFSDFNFIVELFASKHYDDIDLTKRMAENEIVCTVLPKLYLEKFSQWLFVKESLLKVRNETEKE